MSQTALLRATVGLLDAARIPYMVVGSYASAFHGEPRMTRDIDIVVEPTSESMETLVDLVDRDRYYLSDAQAALIDRSMFNLIEPASGWKVDFVVRKDRPFSKTEFSRRIPARVADVDIFIASAEDTVLAKLEWGMTSGSDRQMTDAVAIAKAQDLDRDYLRRWASELGISSELETALEHARTNPGEGQ